jgi:hypothetical protein
MLVMIRCYKRRLSEKERKLLTVKAKHLNPQRRIVDLKKTIGRFCVFIAPPMVLVIGLLSNWYAKSHGVALGCLLFFCLGLPPLYYLGFRLWELYELEHESPKRVDEINAAISFGEARVIHCQSEQVVVFEEIEDEGADYCFQIEDSKLLFVGGQDFYETRRFPNSDFEIVEAGSESHPVLFHIYCNREKLKPVKTIPAGIKKRFITPLGVMPTHLETIEGRWENIEGILETRLKKVSQTT